jgi:hypothetical protein
MKLSSSGDILENIEELKVALKANIKGVVCIKPRVIFQLIEKNLIGSQIINLPIPSSKIGSVTTLEASLICSLIKLRTPRSIFEFGTFLGYTTSIFVLNSSIGTKIYSLDLPVNRVSTSNLDKVDWNLVRSDDAYNDQFLSNLASTEGEFYLKNLQSSENLKLIKMNSLDFDPAEFDLERKVDFVFIDGGHTEMIVKSDTENSLGMCSKNGLILWHDYNSTIHGKVTEVVRNFAKDNLVLHVQHTLLAFTGSQFLNSLLDS